MPKWKSVLHLLQMAASLKTTIQRILFHLSKIFLTKWKRSNKSNIGQKKCKKSGLLELTSLSSSSWAEQEGSSSSVVERVPINSDVTCRWRRCFPTLLKEPCTVSEQGERRRRASSPQQLLNRSSWKLNNNLYFMSFLGASGECPLMFAKRNRFFKAMYPYKIGQNRVKSVVAETRVI